MLFEADEPGLRSRGASVEHESALLRDHRKGKRSSCESGTRPQSYTMLTYPDPVIGSTRTARLTYRSTITRGETRFEMHPQRWQVVDDRCHDPQR